MAVGDKVLASWFNDIYTILSTTMPTNGITTNIAARSVNAGDKITADSVNELITQINSLETNRYVRNADWTNKPKPVTRGQLIKENYTRAFIDEIIDQTTYMCGNDVTSFSKTDNPAYGFSDLTPSYGDSQTISFRQFQTESISTPSFNQTPIFNAQTVCQNCPGNFDCATPNINISDTPRLEARRILCFVESHFSGNFVYDNFGTTFSQSSSFSNRNNTNTCNDCVYFGDFHPTTGFNDFHPLTFSQRQRIDFNVGGANERVTNSNFSN